MLASFVFITLGDGWGSLALNLNKLSSAHTASRRRIKKPGKARLLREKLFSLGVDVAELTGSGMCLINWNYGQIDSPTSVFLFCSISFRVFVLYETCFYDLPFSECYFLLWFLLCSKREFTRFNGKFITAKSAWSFYFFVFIVRLHRGITAIVGKIYPN